MPLLAIGCLATSCDTGTGELSEQSTAADSLMYYVAQSNGLEYQREALRDTTLKASTEKEAYLTGVRTGLNLLKEGDENYNRGVMMGISMAAQIMQYAEANDVQLDKAMYLRSLTNAVMADTLPDMREVQTGIQNAMKSIEEQKAEKDKAASRETLAEAAKAQSLPQITEDLYGKITEKTDSAALKKDDNVTISFKLYKEDGEVINLPLQNRGKIGSRSFPELISDALLTMKDGETGEYLTTAHGLFGAMASRRGMEPSQIIKITLSASLVPQPKPQEEATTEVKDNDKKDSKPEAKTEAKAKTDDKAKEKAGKSDDKPAESSDKK